MYIVNFARPQAGQLKPKRLIIDEVKIKDKISFKHLLIRHILLVTIIDIFIHTY